MKKPKLIPALTTLTAAAVTCIFCFIEHVSFGLFLKRVAIAAVVFLIFGLILRLIIEWNFPPEEPVDEEAEGEESEDDDIKDVKDTEKQ